jgi:hypothetical protein
MRAIAHAVRRLAAASGYGYGRDDGRNISVESAQFNVILGNPSWLRVDTRVANAWAGGQPFGVQPRVAVIDKGGNIVYDARSYDHNMTATLITNPSNATLIGDTAVRTCALFFFGFGVRARCSS